jgi:three-Cys-motif partner protein
LEASLATGTTGGLLDSNDHAQSIFKHAIIRHYLPPFLAMTGSTSARRRLVVMDGYAGRGRYSDGNPGSAELILQAVERLQESRTVATFFAETNLENYRALAVVVGEYTTKGLPATALYGPAEEHLASVIAAAQGVPLFLFLDPCGAILPFSQLAEILSVQRRAVRPPTELLLNFSADFTRRTAGQLAKGQLDAGGVRRMDVTCGTTKWREAAMNAHRASADGTFELAAEAVVRGYSRHLAQAAGMIPVMVPVRRRLHLQPVYHLVFLTRSQYGVWVFADALGKARQEWLRATGRLDDDSGPQLALPGMSKEDDMQYLVDKEGTWAQETVEENLRGLIRPGLAPVRLVDRGRSVFGDAYGIATEATVSAAVRALEHRRELVTVRSSSRIRDRVVGPA